MYTSHVGCFEKKDSFVEHEMITQEVFNNIMESELKIIKK